ncbi:exported hypothetical protein [Xanthomonas citri pv. bilvae]|nr:exported hypothetical protein [Xanthomonas citri pv. bilvae]
MQSFSRLSVGTRLSALLTLVIATSLGLLTLTIYRQSAGDIESQVGGDVRRHPQRRHPASGQRVRRHAPRRRARTR